MTVGVLAPIVVFAALVVFQLARLERDEAQRRLVHAARGLSESLDRELTGTIRTLQALAESNALERDDLQTFADEARRVIRTEPTWLTVILVEADGTQVLNTRLPSGAAMPPLQESWSFQRLLESKEPVVGHVVRGFDGSLAFPVRVPVLRDGEVKYALTAVITSEGLKSVVNADTSPEVWARTLVDGAGVVAARTRDPSRFVGQKATSEFLEKRAKAGEGVHSLISIDGQKVYSALTFSKLSGWTASVVAPRDVLDGPVKRSTSISIGFGLALLLLSGLAAYLLSRRIEVSIQQASAAADALSTGATVVLEPTKVHELDELQASLERSAELLQQRELERDEHLAAAEAARSEAIAATRAKDEFLALLGHELRNPLAPLVTSLEILKRKGLAGTPQFDVMSRQLSHVVRLVDDLLDLSRITRGKLTLMPEPTELATVIDRAVEMTSPLIVQHQHVLTRDVPDSGLVVNADPDRLTQVIANLLTNAARYTPDGGRIQLRAAVDEGEVVVSVEDNGQGITQDLLSKIFDAFIQGPRSIDRKEGGLGIGLALVRSVVVAHGGRVEAASAGLGRGSTFTIRIPRSHRQVTPQARPAVSAPTEASPLRILIVDDNVDAAEALGDFLALEGYLIALAHDGEAALRELESFEADIVLLDIGLPRADGYTVSAHIRDRFPTRVPIFAALTGYGQANDRERSVEAGFQYHFVKPVNVDELLQVLEKHRARAA
jgi:signal transduction histidine kinase/ActR/RegA family two-component response regulator